MGEDDDEGSDFLEEQSRAPPDAAADVHDQSESPVRDTCAFAYVPAPAKNSAQYELAHRCQGGIGS